MDGHVRSRLFHIRDAETPRFSLWRLTCYALDFHGLTVSWVINWKLTESRLPVSPTGHCEVRPHPDSKGAASDHALEGESEALAAPCRTAE